MKSVSVNPDLWTRLVDWAHVNPTAAFVSGTVLLLIVSHKFRHAF